MSNNTLRMSFPKETVLQTLKTNRENHKKVYESTISNWLISVFKESNDLLRCENVDHKQVNIKNVTQKLKTLKDLDAPVNFLPAYDRAIEMLELSLDSNIEMDTNQFKEYMKDEWCWKDQWRYSNTKYGLAEDWDG